MNRLRRSALVVASALTAATAVIAGAGGSEVGAATPLSRPADPVVLTGADLPSLQGSLVGRIVAFKANGSGWTQIPTQIDERAVLDLGVVYHEAPNGVQVLGYTSAATWAGPDPTMGLDADDEVAFMSRDTGPVATATAAPAGTVAGSGVRVQVSDPLAPGATGYVYLFRTPTGSSLRPGAGKQYVKYAFKLASGLSYKSSYNLTDGPNPEDTLATGANYRHHFGDRWLEDRIEIIAPRASGVDILDRHKNMFAPGYCGRTEDTFDDAEGAFVVNKVGAVRAIRSYIGANSGPSTQRTHVFYDRREDMRTDLRVHTVGSMMDFFDYSPAADGMRYRNETNPAGVIVDGVPDTLTDGTNGWEQITGAQGTLTMVAQLSATFPTTLTPYYLDDTTPPVTQCTGDAFAYGSSGSYITSSLPCTDPALGCTDTLSGTRTMYFGVPGGTAATASTLRNRTLTPLTATTAVWP